MAYQEYAATTSGHGTRLSGGPEDFPSQVLSDPTITRCLGRLAKLNELASELSKHAHHIADQMQGARPEIAGESRLKEAPIGSVGEMERLIFAIEAQVERAAQGLSRVSAAHG